MNHELRDHWSSVPNVQEWVWAWEFIVDVSSQCTGQLNNSIILDNPA